MPRAAHQRTTTYELTPGDPPRIDLTTEYRPPVLPAGPALPVDPTPAVVGAAFVQAQSMENLTAIARVSLSDAQMLRPAAQSTTVWTTEPLNLTLKTQGLIRVRGGRMTYIVSKPGGPRPASFDTRPGDGLTHVTLERVPTRAVNP